MPKVTVAKVREEVAAKNRVEKKIKVDITGELNKAIKAQDENWYDLAKWCREAYDNTIWEVEGYPDIKLYIAGALSGKLEYRKFNYLVFVGGVFKKVGVTKEQVAELGWTKAKDLAHLMTEGAIEDNLKLIENAKNMSADEVANFVRTQRKIEATGDVPRTKMTLRFSLWDEPAQVVTVCLERAKQLVGIDDDNMALEYICKDWAARLTDTTADANIISSLYKPEEVDTAKLQKKHETQGKKKNGNGKKKDKEIIVESVDDDIEFA